MQNSISSSSPLNLELPAQGGAYGRMQLGSLALHLLLLAICLFMTTYRLPTIPKKFAVRTVSLRPPRPAPQARTIQQAAPPAQGMPAPLPEKAVAAPPPAVTRTPASPPKPAAKKTVVTKPAVKKSPPKNPPKPPPQKATEISRKQEALLAEALSCLDSTVKARSTIDKKKASMEASPSPCATPRPIISCASDEGEEQASSYSDALVQHLQRRLRLPEQGTIRVTLTLQRSGKVSTMQITSCLNQENRSYLEDQLKKMRFPEFRTAFTGQAEHTFHLCFSCDGG